MLKKYNSKLLQHSIDNFSKNKIDTCLKRNLSKSTEWLRILQANVESSHNEPFPRETKVVVCGGGVMGAAVAYHLAELGWGKHTIVVEQGRAGCATTWQSSGLVGIFKPTRAQVKLCQSSVKLYQKLDAEGFSSGWKQCGSLCVARTLDRMTVFRRMKAQSVALRVDCELVSPEEAKRLCPLLNVDDLKGGLWIPGDGVGDPYRICLSLLEAAKKKGVRVYEYCGVQQVVQEGGRVRGVETSLGSVQCEAFVNCGGFWARSIGKLSEPFVKVPLHAVEHYYLHTKKIPGLDPMTPDYSVMEQNVRLMEIARTAMEIIKDCSINDTESDPEPMDEDETYFDLSYAPSPDMFDNEYDNNSEAEHDRALSSLDKNKELDNIALPSIADDGNEVGGDEVESNGVGGEEVEADEVEGRKKKGRKRRYGGQDRDERKKCKYSQKDYFNYKKKKVPAKVFIDVNCGCSMECQQNNPLEVRRSEYENFVELGSYESQNLFITSKITQVYKKKKRSYSASSKRYFTRVYKLNKYSVCRDMFVKTLQVSTKRVNTILSKIRSGESVAEQRGKTQGGWNKSDHEKIENVMNHIKSIPKYVSHYRRSTTDSEFLAPDMTIHKVYDLYREEGRDPVSLATYKKIFYKKFNLRTKRLKKDTCNLCDTLSIEL